MRFALFAFSMGCSRPPTEPAPLVLLVSFDTTRADALSCYGASDAATPHADALAHNGVRFEWAISSSSTTLAAHTAVMSGRDSHDHQVPRNGFAVPPELPLLAERFHAAGWYTLASVGSYALEESMGLNRGFDRYEDHADWKGAVFGLYEASGSEVTRSAMSLVDTRPRDTPVFLFVHYYDPHMPWTSAPASVRVGFVDPKYRGKVAGDRTGIGFLTNQTVQGSLSPEDRAHARGLYLAEVAWADQQLGRLLDGLRERNLLDDSLVVLFSDHGEMFDEEPARPWRHGPDVDLPIIHVPLIVSGTGTLATPQRTVVPTTVRTLDIGSTLLNAIGQSDPLGEGRDLSTLWRGQPPEDWPVALAEATKPLEQLRTDTWPNANLERAAVSQTQITTRAPWLDALDHSFQRDAVQTPTATPEPSLTAALDAFDARQPDHRSPAYGNETRDALKALGYLDD